MIYASSTICLLLLMLMSSSSIDTGMTWGIPLFLQCLSSSSSMSVITSASFCGCSIFSSLMAFMLCSSQCLLLFPYGPLVLFNTSLSFGTSCYIRNTTSDSDGFRTGFRQWAQPLSTFHFLSISNTLPHSLTVAYSQPSIIAPIPT
jgi:hypothetical protein